MFIVKVLILSLELLGALGIFLLGIKMMSDGLQKAAGDRLRKIIFHATNNRFIATLSGIVATSIIQSSSALTLYVDILTGFEKMGDYALNVVQSNTGQPKH